MLSRLDEDVLAGVRAAASALADAGFAVEETEIPDAYEAGEVGHLLTLVDGAASFDSRFRAHPELFGADVRSLIEDAHSVRAVDYLNAQRYRRVFQRKLDRMFDEYRVLLVPATPIAAPPIAGGPEDAGVASTRLVRPFNLAGVPVLTVPCGFDRDGMPFGLQIVSRAGDELSGLRVGAVYQQVTSWHQRRPRVEQSE